MPRRISNVQRLIVHKLALLIVPVGSGRDAMEIGRRNLTEPGNAVRLAREAKEWVLAAITAVKTAPDNPYGDNDELIAGEILRRMEERGVQT